MAKPTPFEIRINDHCTIPEMTINFFKSRKQAPGLVHGAHLILEPTGSPKWDKISHEELAGVILAAIKAVPEMQERFSGNKISESAEITVMLKGLATRPNVHIHLKLPGEKDQMFYAVYRGFWKFLQQFCFVVWHQALGLKLKEPAVKVQKKIKKLITESA